MNLQTQEKNMFTRFKERIPGTVAHAERHVHDLFDERSFDAEKLSSVEAAVLQDSIDEKYVPALVESRRARALGLLIGSIAPYEFLLLGAVTLAASASSTTGAWYSITLKEMKEKFEGMGLRLTKDLLTADMLANALSMYAGIGLAHKMIAYPELVEFVQDPNPINAARALGALAVSGTIHGALESILSRKEDASVCFDFNDATLAGMTEEQQRFFSQSVSDVNRELTQMNSAKQGPSFNRSVHRCMKHLLELVEGFDKEAIHPTKELTQSIFGKTETYYRADLLPFVVLCSRAIQHISSMMVDEQLKIDLDTKLRLLDELTKDYSEDNPCAGTDKLTAILADTIPMITSHLEQFGEKAISSKREKPWSLFDEA